MPSPPLCLRRSLVALLLTAGPALGAGPTPVALQTAVSPIKGVAPSASEARLPLRYVLDRVVIHGNDHTSSEVILRYVPFHPGELLDPDDPKLRAVRYSLLGTGFFRDVSLSLTKSESTNHVVLNITVGERNTLVVSDLWMGLAASADSDGKRPPQMLSPFAGLSVAENNLFGSGASLGAATVFSNDQRALSVRFLNPSPLGSRWMLSTQALFADGLGFFGNSAVKWDNPRLIDQVPRQAVTQFRRISGELGIGTHLSLSTEIWFHYRAENLLAWPPDAAAHEYGGTLEPIDFSIHRGRSLLSTLGTSLKHDTRDQPVLTSRGVKASASILSSLAPLGSDYSYQRLDLTAQGWWSLGAGHVVSLSTAAAAIAGYAPFFERLHISDFSDLRPGRILGLNFDDRPAPNFLGTSISEVRYGDFGASVQGTYRMPLYRGSRAIFGIDAFVSGGLFVLASHRDIVRPPKNRSGLELIPMDLTGNIGLQLDTNLGGITISFANALGFLRNGGVR